MAQFVSWYSGDSNLGLSDQLAFIFVEAIRSFGMETANTDPLLYKWQGESGPKKEEVYHFFFYQPTGGKKKVVLIYQSTKSVTV